MSILEIATSLDHWFGAQQSAMPMDATAQVQLKSTSSLLSKPGVKAQKSLHLVCESSASRILAFEAEAEGLVVPAQRVRSCACGR